MPLILRTQIDRTLTAQEMDGNLVYLESISGGTGSGTGSVGPQGPAGATGPQGIQGPTGSGTGSSFTGPSNSVVYTDNLGGLSASNDFLFNGDSLDINLSSGSSSVQLMIGSGCLTCDQSASEMPFCWCI
jgi:hypothetical protein